MRFRRSQKLEVRATIDLVPFITVLFLLLLFFLLTSTFKVYSSLNVEYAKAPGPVTFEEKKDLSVTLAYDEGRPGGMGSVYVNDAAVADLEELSRVLAEASAGRPDLRLLIRPDARVPSGRLIEVIGIAQNAGIDRYQILTQPPAAAP